MGKDAAMNVIDELVKGRVFRARDLTRYRISQSWLVFAKAIGMIRHHGRGVWSSRDYCPTRYELVQIRFPRAVFWGPSALWLQGQLPEEPESLWIAITNKSQLPTTLEIATVVIRTRHLERSLTSVRPTGCALTLRVHDIPRALADFARVDQHRVLERAAERSKFTVAPAGTLLSAGSKWAASPDPPERWVVSARLTSRSG